MTRNIVRTVVALGLAAVAATAVAAPASARTIQACRDIGNGDVCIKLENLNDTTHRADITTWYTKRSGNPVVVRLAYFPGDGIDEGAFTISAGEIRGYKWFNVYLGVNNCYTGALRQGGDPNWSIVINGGTTCRW